MFFIGMFRSIVYFDYTSYLCASNYLFIYVTVKLYP